MHTEKERILETASELGLVVDRLKALLDRSEKEIEDGLLPAAQIAMARNGELLFEYAVGKANVDSLICIFSATKAITSAHSGRYT
jgi:CubicO group peptidase (beta-lactamase class C family)